MLDQLVDGGNQHQQDADEDGFFAEGLADLDTGISLGRLAFDVLHRSAWITDQHRGTPASKPTIDTARQAGKVAHEAVKRMCSPRRSATTGPSTASQTNNIVASSSAR